ncbi:unnamed protein product [Rotaria sordida]|uniref:Uncharacterized protein n=1 Tax=Rotaria sordida TaxID=392033 RepID=A0A815MIM3_9BILA|nr:unnamed protein product [Rotaria sordida]
MDINERFAQLVVDPLYIHNLDMTIMNMKSFYDRTFSIDDKILSRICDNILPRIHNQVTKLTVEQHSIERILTINYPQLYFLTLVNFKEEILFKYLTDYSILHNLKNQITHLNIDIQNEMGSELSEISSNIFLLILSLCKRLTHLNFCQLFSYRDSSIYISELSRTSYISSSLVELKINVSIFDDCLDLLDGYLDNLTKLIINVKQIKYKQRSNINNLKQLPKLKCFSLTSINYTHVYDEHITQLLHQMINLEELILFLTVVRIDSNFIDGHQLYDEVVFYMPKLNKFLFSINTSVILKNIDIDFSSNEYIQRSFIGKGYGQVGSYVFPKSINIVRRFLAYPELNIRGGGRSHIFSLPYSFKYFLDLNNSFQGGMFDNVQYLKMNDIRPFEYQLFKKISENFPCLKELIICNREAQTDKQHLSTLIRFPHLILLNLVMTHVDYAEQFLSDKKTDLPCLLDLCIEYESLIMVTNNFTNNATRLHCAKLKGLHINKPFVRPKHFHQYFPLL